MSLDISLRSNQSEDRECYCCGNISKYYPEVFEYNITHNLTEMAKEAGIYLNLWRPEELGIKIAKDLIEPLEKGLEILKSDPDHFKKFDAKNGWGKYENLVEFVAQYLQACKDNPESTVYADR